MLPQTETTLEEESALYSSNLLTGDKLSLGDFVDVNRLSPAKEKVDGLAGTEFNEDEVALKRILEDRLELCVIWLSHSLTSFDVGPPLFNSFSLVCNTGVDRFRTHSRRHRPTSTC